MLAQQEKKTPKKHSKLMHLTIFKKKKPANLDINSQRMESSLSTYPCFTL